MDRERLELMNQVRSDLDNFESIVKRIQQKQDWGYTWWSDGIELPPLAIMATKLYYLEKMEKKKSEFESL